MCTLVQKAVPLSLEKKGSGGRIDPCNGIKTDVGTKTDATARTLWDGSAPPSRLRIDQLSSGTATTERRTIGIAQDFSKHLGFYFGV